MCPANVPQLDRMCSSSTAVELRRRCLSALARGRGAAPAGRVVPAESPIATDPAGASLGPACGHPSLRLATLLNPAAAGATLLLHSASAGASTIIPRHWQALKLTAIPRLRAFGHTGSAWPVCFGIIERRILKCTLRQTRGLSEGHDHDDQTRVRVHVQVTDQCASKASLPSVLDSDVH